jgi:hypothetical protein
LCPEKVCGKEVATQVLSLSPEVAIVDVKGVDLIQTGAAVCRI